MLPINAECPLCKGKLSKTLLVMKNPDRFERSLDINDAKWAREWRQCSQCFAAINIMMDIFEDQLDKIADQYYEIDLSTNISDRFKSIMSLPNEKSDNYYRVRRIQKFLDFHICKTTKYNILDIGSGLGVFPAKFLELNDGRLSRFHAIEPDPIAANHLKELSNIEFIQGMFDSSWYGPIFHLITLNKVIEHIRMPQVLLKSIKDVMCPEGGIIYVEVPHVQTIYSREQADNILGSLHKHLYSQTTLSLLLRNCGYEILESGFLNEPSSKLTCYAFATPKLEHWS